MTKKTAKLIIDDKEYELPILEAKEGANVIDISQLYSKAGYFTYDPGFLSTASCQSDITYIDGDKGILRYRGYEAVDLADNCDFLEVCYLLLNDDLPNAKQKKQFDHDITFHTMIHDQAVQLLAKFPRRAHPMAIFIGLVASLSAFYHDEIDINDKELRKITELRIIAKMPSLAGMVYKYMIGQPMVYPDNSLDFSSNFLNMMFSNPCEKYTVNPILKQTVNKLFILHADHEQNASTSTVRLAGSSGANPYACIGAGIASLWGPAHGGANEAVIKMLKEIGDEKNISHFIKRAKDKDDSFRLMGFGHRIYKNYDPRAKLLKKVCDDTLEVIGKSNDKLLNIAKKLEKIALEDEYFISKKLYPNVDFYSGIVYRALDIPTSMFTAMFAISRAAGWVAQWKEMIEEPGRRIGRPRQLYVGECKREFIPMSKRKQ